MQQSLPAAVRAGDVQPVHGVNCACVKLPLTDVTVTFSLFKINHCTNISLVVVLNILTVFFAFFLSLPQHYSSLLQRPLELNAYGQLYKLGDDII